MVDFLAEEEKLEADAKAVLGGSDAKNCTYPKGYLSRQALYACSTCTPDSEKPAGVCLACSYECHEGHELFELYTKRNFRCDCGNKKFPTRCKLFSDKADYNEENKYNHNFSGRYCTCNRPYPDPDDDVEDEMFQCVICEDWLHERHLNLVLPDRDVSIEIVCSACMKACPFLWSYQLMDTVVKMEKSEDTKVDVESVDSKKEPTADSTTAIKPETQEKALVPNSDPKIKEEKPDVKAGTSNGVKTEQSENISPRESSADGNECLSKESTSKKNECFYKELQQREVTPKDQSTYWMEGWRDKLCTCDSCLEMYKKHGVSFLTDQKDLISEYEAQGQGVSTDTPTGLEALSRMNRVQQIEVIHGYNDLKSELTDYLKKFADSNKVVREEDIREFFTGMEARKRQRTNGVPSHFCK